MVGASGVGGEGRSCGGGSAGGLVADASTVTRGSEDSLQVGQRGSGARPGTARCFELIANDVAACMGMDDETRYDIEGE